MRTLFGLTDTLVIVINSNVYSRKKTPIAGCFIFYMSVIKVLERFAHNERIQNSHSVVFCSFGSVSFVILSKQFMSVGEFLF